ncbi:MAG: sigma-70 family RNA polymerase sigma factor [Planctomycetota bacterium]
MSIETFHTTRWSLVAGAGAGEPRDRRTALEELLGAYWHPLYAFLRRKGRDPERASDLVQGFLAQLLERDAFARLEREGGRFRSWLLTGLVNHERDAHAAESAAKRGGGALHVSIESGEQRYALEARTDADPAAVFERAWAREVLERARRALVAEAIARGRGDLMRSLLPLVDGACTADERATLAERSGLSPVALRVALHRARARLRELILAEVQETVPDACDAREELAELARALETPTRENSDARA